MKEKKKIPWGLIYVGLTVVVMIVFGLVNTEFAGMFSVIANLSLGFVALAVLMTGVFLVTEGGIITVNTETADTLGIDHSVFNDLGTVVEVQTTED